MAYNESTTEIILAILIIAQCLCILKLMRSENKSRRWGVRLINQRRPVLGEFETLFHEMQDDEEYFFKYTRMSVDCYKYLLEKVTPFLLKRSRRKPLTPGHRLSMTLRWRILDTHISAHPQRVDNIVMAIICLHNFLMSVNNKADKNNRRYCPSSYIDQEAENGHVRLGDWRFDGNDQLQSFPTIRPGSQGTINGGKMRQALTTYFLSRESAVPWQLDYVRRDQNQDNR
ncbi:uncharacterized protein LOC127288573 isoform X2 [Leptopilina boulardi]|nr:uncharacterized protein LOC127288573 isoform X2 [Leptopilina boulardi]